MNNTRTQHLPATALVRMKARVAKTAPRIVLQMTVAALGALFLAGCRTGPPSQYISPRVTGRVLDVRTREPVADVHVRREIPPENPTGLNTPRGGKSLIKTPAARTGADGAFALDSVRDLELFQRVGWYSVTLSFEHPHYERLVVTYTLKDAIRTADGEPWVKGKDILMSPPAK